MPNKEGKATKGHAFVCMSCGLQRTYVGALVIHIRGAHQRRVSAPEYLQITDRQATAISERLSRVLKDRSAPASGLYTEG